MTSVQRLTIIILLYNFLSVNSRLFVQDIRLPGGSSNPVNRTYATSAAQPWHVDECDIVGNSAARSVQLITSALEVSLILPAFLCSTAPLTPSLLLSQICVWLSDQDCNCSHQALIERRVLLTW